MTRSAFVLFFFLISLGGRPLLATEEGSSGGAGSGQSSGQETADTGKPDPGKKSAKPEDPAKPEDKEPECD